eukprot:504775-Prorocentrum_minimum.AAC.2
MKKITLPLRAGVVSDSPHFRAAGVPGEPHGYVYGSPECVRNQNAKTPKKGSFQYARRGQREGWTRTRASVSTSTRVVDILDNRFGR